MMIDFNSVVEEMKVHGIPLPKQKISISVPGSHQTLRKAFDHFLSLEGLKTIWRKEYDAVGDWLSNNRGRGLFLLGDCGLGKSLLGRYILPAIILNYCRKVVNVYNVNEMNDNLDELLTKQFISLDDIGTEEITNKYGNKRLAFAEIMDSVEKNSKLVIISTNLDKDALIEKYGYRVMDRIISTTTRVKFTGKSLRK